MNHSEVVNAVASKTDLDERLCDQVIKAFEEASGGAILGKIGGKHLNTAEITAKIAAVTAVPEETCERILAALDEVLGQGLSNKLGFGGSK